jgi:hypothetical protein
MKPAKARAEYVKTHWGQDGTRGAERLKVATLAEGASLVLLGDLVSVVYRTRKGLDQDAVDYEHHFATPRPRLAYSESGLLVIAGGRYRIDERGIIG